MTTATIAGKQLTVDDEGFLTDPQQWDETIAPALATNIGLELSDDHWAVLRFLRSDFAAEGETATLRRVSTIGGFPTKQLYELFPKKPAKKMAYVAGLPKPKGCI